MPAWSPPALAAALFIAVHYLLLRAASGRVADRVGALVLETAAALGIGVSFLLGSRGEAVANTRAGLGLAAGLLGGHGRGRCRPGMDDPACRGEAVAG